MALSEDEVRKVYESHVKTYERATNALKDLLQALLDDLGGRYEVREGVQISGKQKDFNSFFKKVQSKDVQEAGGCLDAVKDFARARVVVQTLDDVYRIRGLLDEQDSLVPYWGTEEDYIENPQERGYRSLHIHVGVDVSVNGKTQTVPCELQIRTIIQDAWGAFSHKDFYKGAQIPPVFEEQMQELAAILASVDRMGAGLIKNLSPQEHGGDAANPPATTEPAKPRSPSRTKKATTRRAVPRTS
jgi:putative GTP pyrophosphokinase